MTNRVPCKVCGKGILPDTAPKQEGKTVINDTYASPEEVPALMRVWLEGFQQRRQDPAVSAFDAYAWSHATFVRIHPYADGNGRMGRLLANLPVIEKGHLPILIPAEKRLDYIEALASWQLASGAVREGCPWEGDAARLQTFRSLCHECLAEAHAMMQEVRALQDMRHGK